MSAFGSDSESDSGDEWIIVTEKSTSEWQKDQKVSLLLGGAATHMPSNDEMKSFLALCLDQAMPLLCMIGMATCEVMTTIHACQNRIPDTQSHRNANIISI